jgi:hypothetical protein
MVASNAGPARSGSVTIGGHTVAVTQANGCTYQIGAPDQEVPGSGGSRAVSVTTAAGCEWTSSSSASWISISSGGSGAGSGRVEVIVAANAGPARTGSLIIGGQTVTLKQASGCTYNIGPPSGEVSGSGGAIATSVFTAASCPWTATSGAGWIAVSTPSGAGPGQPHLVIAPNPGQPRIGAVTIAGQTFTVMQASQCTYDLRPPSMTQDASGGHGTVLVVVSGPCTWTAESAVGWIALLAGYSSGTGNGMVQFGVAPNPGAARTGIINIAGQNYAVTQSGR